MASSKTNEKNSNTFKIWVIADPHTPVDANDGNVDNVINAYNDIINNVSDYDIALCLGGDYFNPGFNSDSDGVMVARNLANERNKMYGLKGNHDEQPPYALYVDDIGANPSTSGVINAERPIPLVGLSDGSAYYLKKGNLLILMVGDDQIPVSPQGEEDLPATKFYNAAGGYSTAQWLWLTNAILANQDCNIIVCTHHPLENTSFGSGYRESYKDAITWDIGRQGQPDHEVDRNTQLVYVDNVDYRQNFIDFYSSIAGSCLAYFSGHLHLGVDENINGRTWYETAYGMVHANLCPLNKNLFYNITDYPVLGRAFITNNSKYFSMSGKTITIQTYVHSDIGGRIAGLQPDLEKTIQLRYPYDPSFVSSDPSTPAAPSIASIDVSVGGKATLNLNTNSASGVLIVRNTGSYTTFIPDDNTSYLRGGNAGDGVVAFMGTIAQYTDYGLVAGTYYYSVYTFNGGNDKIKFNVSPARLTGAISTANLTTILGAKLLVLLRTPTNGSNVAVDSSNNVIQWNDDSGNALHAVQDLAGSRPAYKNNRITFSEGNYLQIPFTSALSFLDDTTETVLVDMQIGFFTKIKMNDATKFRILNKIGDNGGAAEFQITTDCDDMLAMFLYQGDVNTYLGRLSNIPMTAYEGKDIYIFVNYRGGSVFKWNGLEVKVYDSNRTLISAITTASSDITARQYYHIDDLTLPISIGYNDSDGTYANGEVNGIVLTKGGIIEEWEIPYILDNY